MGFFAFDGKLLVLVPLSEEAFVSDHSFNPQNTKNPEFRCPRCNERTAQRKDMIFFSFDGEFLVLVPLSEELFMSDHSFTPKNTKFWYISILLDLKTVIGI